jgi:hypothetical protein
VISSSKRWMAALAAQLGQEHLDEQTHREDHCKLAGQRLLGPNGSDSAVDGALVAHVVTAEEVSECLISGALGQLESGPALDEVDEDGGFFIAEPADDLRKVGLQGSDEPVGDADATIDERAPRLDETAERSHGSALLLEPRELLRMAKQELEGELSVGRVILGAAGSKRVSVARQRAGLDGK